MEEKSNGLAIASFVLALVGIFLCFTIVFSILGIICIILSLIFGIIALCKKQTPRAAWTGTIISGIIVIIGIILTITVGTFISKHSDQIITPIKDLQEWTENNPEYVDLLKNEDFSNEFSKVYEEKIQNKTDLLEEKYNNKENVNNDELINDILSVWSDIFYEIPNIVEELSVNYNLDNSENSNQLTNEKDNDELNILEGEGNVGLGNPASTYCEQNGGTLVLESNEDGDYGVCVFADGTSCEERAYYRGECPAK